MRSLGPITIGAIPTKPLTPPGILIPGIQRISFSLGLNASLMTLRLALPYLLLLRYKKVINLGLCPRNIPRLQREIGIVVLMLRLWRLALRYVLRDIRPAILPGQDIMRVQRIRMPAPLNVAVFQVYVRSVQEIQIM